MSYTYTHTPVMLTYTSDMLVTYRWKGQVRTDLTAAPNWRLHSPAVAATWNTDYFEGDTILVGSHQTGTRKVPKADVIRVGRRTFASSIEVDDVVLCDDGMTQEVIEIGSDGDDVVITFDGEDDNVGSFDSSDYSLFVVVADVDA